jgi:hypothetical protein
VSDYDHTLAGKIFDAVSLIQSYRDDKIMVGIESGHVKVIIGGPKMNDRNFLVFDAGDGTQMLIHGRRYTDPEVTIFRPGQWVDYLLKTLLPKAEARREQEHTENFSPIDDSELFS